MSYRVRFPAATVFIETGHGHGESLREAMRQQPYQRLYSLELDPRLAAAGRAAFSPGSRVVILQGASTTILPLILDPMLPTTFWLDAHLCLGDYTQDAARDRRLARAVGTVCPLIEELAIIHAVSWHHAPHILIDDAVCFDPALRYLEPRYTAEEYADYPTMDVLAAAVPGYQITRHHAGRGLYLHVHP